MDKRLTGNTRAKRTDADYCHNGKCGNGEGSFELMWVNAQVDDAWANERQQCSGCSRHDWTETWTGREWATGR